MSQKKVPEEYRPEFKRKLLHKLGRGKAAALTGLVLASYCGYDPEGQDRMTRIMIRELITDGVPIASSTGNPAGFYIADTKEEVERYAKGLRGRLIEDALRRRDFLRAARCVTHPEQLRMTMY